MIYVIDNDGEKSEYQPKKITHKIMEETGLDKEEAEKIQRSITYLIKDHYQEEYVSTTTLRSIINQKLIQKGYIEEEQKSQKLGMSISDFEELLHNGNNDNANIQYSPEMINKYASDSIAKQYALYSMPEDCSKAHIDGYVHHHDLEHYNLRPNCVNFDLRFFARNGLKIDGKGLMGSVSKPAKSLEVLLNHMLQAFMAGATVFSGGQGYANFNTLLAPFCRGRTYKEIKQAIQGFIFNCNMSLVCRGGQVLFSSIALDLSCPDVLANEPAVTFGGITQGTYKDYQEEADMIFRAVCEVSNEKDGQGRWHRFPNILFNIRENDLDEYSGTCKLLHETGANNPTIYYTNCTDLERTIMGCVSGDTEIWVRIDNHLQLLTFKEISDYLGADYGATSIDNIEVLTINDKREIVWEKAKYFIRNKPQQTYKVTLQGNKSFICDENHGMITYKGMNKIPILEANNNLLSVNYKESNNAGIVQDKMATLYGFLLGDGLKTNPNYEIVVLVKEDKKKYLRNLLETLNIEYVETIHERHGKYKDETYFQFKKLDYKPDLEDKNVLLGLLAGLLSSDGYIRINGAYNNSLCAEWVTTNKEHGDLFKWCCFNLGLKFRSRWIIPHKPNHKPYERIYISCNKESVNVLKSLELREKQHETVQKTRNSFRSIKPYSSTSMKELTPLNEEEETYCFEVNGRMIITTDFILTSNCRTALPMNYRKNYDDDCLNTGNFMYTTINLPLIAYESKDEEEFYKTLDYYCEIVYKTLHHRRAEVEKALYDLHTSDFLLQKDKETGKPLYTLDRATYTIGFCGLNEALLELYGNGVLEAHDDGVKIVQFLNNKKNEFNNRDGWRWSVIGSPAESTSSRFAKINKEKHADAIVQGEKGNYYLTNSSHIPVSDTSDIIEHIKNADTYHPLTLGGNLLHIWLGEVWSDPEALWKLNQKILKTNTRFWAYSKVFTYCQECEFTINDNLKKCPICGSEDLVVYDRITGYYLPVITRRGDDVSQQWNNGKLQEFKDRYRHDNVLSKQ